MWASLDEDPAFDDRLSMAYVAAVAEEAELAAALVQSARVTWDAADRFVRARIHAALGDLDEGIRWYEKALQGGFPHSYGAGPTIRRLEAHAEWEHVRERFPPK